MNKWLTEIVSILIAIVIGYSLGYMNGSSKAQIKTVTQQNYQLQEWLKIAKSMSDSFSIIAANTVQKKAEVIYVTQTVIEKGETHVQETEQSYSADDVLYNLRLCSYQILYQAADADLPGGGAGIACPPALAR